MSSQLVVVYGGSGFLGSHVVDALTEAGYKVRVFDQKPSTYLKDGQEMILGNLMDLEAVVKAAEGCRFVYNFAGLADLDEARDQPIETANQNVVGNIHVMEAARLAQAERFVFASSVYVYSTSGSFYRASKQAAEQYIEAYQERYGLDYTILRYGSLFGRRADTRNGIYRLIKQALEKGSITYGGDGDSLREFIHVTDAAKLSVQILGQEYANRHMILTGQESMSVKNLMRMIAEMTPGKIDLNFSNEPLYGHYMVTPYGFHPKLGHKLVATDYVDLGQGLLDCMAELHEKNHSELHRENGLLIEDVVSKA